METDVRSFDLDQIPPNCGIIDVGGVLCGRKGREVAEKMLQKSNPYLVDGVIYYEGQEPYVLDRSKASAPLGKCLIPKERLIAFWEQQFTVGSDLSLGEKATSCVLIGKHTILRDVLQGIWRMRRLGKGQSVSFALDKEAEKVLRKKIHPGKAIQMKHVFAFALSNQIDRLRVDNGRAFSNKADALLQKEVVEALTTSEGEALRASFEKGRDLFFSAEGDWYGRPKEIVSIDKQIEDVRTRVVNHPCISLSTPKEFDLLKKTMERCLPKEIERTVLGAPGSDVGTLVQIQEQAMTQVSSQVLTNVEALVTSARHNPESHSSFVYNLVHGRSIKICTDIVPPSGLLGKNGALSKMGGIPPEYPYDDLCGLQKLLEAYDTTKPFASAVAKNLCTSTTIINPRGEPLGFLHRRGSIPDSFHPCSANIPPASYMVCYQEKNRKDTRKFVIVSQHEAVEFLSADFKGELPAAIVIDIHTGKAFYPPGNEWLAKDVTDSLDTLAVRVQAKLLSGNFRLTTEEQLGFLAWCVEGAKWQTVSAFLNTYLMAIRPAQAGDAPSLNAMIATRGYDIVDHLLQQHTQSGYDEPTRKEAAELLHRLRSNRAIDKEMLEKLVGWLRRT